MGKPTKRMAAILLGLVAAAAASALVLRAQEMRNIRIYTVHVASTDGKPVPVDGTFWVDGGIPHARVVHQNTPFDLSDAGTMANGVFAAAHGTLRVTLTIQGGGSAEAEGPIVAVVQGMAPAAGRGLIKTFAADGP